MAQQREISVPGYGALKPLQQGALDRLCGLYCIINAVALAAYPLQPLQPRQRRLLFDEGIRFLGRRRRLELASLDGMNERLWMHLRDHLLTTLGPIGGAQSKAVSIYPRGRPDCVDSALAGLFKTIDAGAPVLTLLWGVYNHWTVVAGYTPSKLLLFDSGGLQWVNIRSIGLRHPRHKGRHKLTWRSSAGIVFEV
ncbi:hypothetical protein [Sphingomonas sp.]|uniref:hypothetical protein n=1 Tax=Sphingomonas sp. TaxID=28214 RepID=UPI003B3B6569